MTGCFLKAKLETQQTGIVPGIFGPRRRWRDAETHFKQRDAFENRDGHFVRESKACLNFKRLKETFLAVLTLLAEFAGAGGFH